MQTCCFDLAPILICLNIIGNKTVLAERIVLGFRSEPTSGIPDPKSRWFDFPHNFVVNSAMEKLKILPLVFFTLLLFISQSISAQKRVHVSYDLIITGGTIVTMDQSRQVIENGTIAVRDGKIAYVGKGGGLPPNTRPKKVIDAKGKVIVPGLINTHTHVPMGLFRGIADDLDLQDWLTKYIFPAVASFC